MKIKLISFDYDGVIVHGFNTWYKIRELKNIPEGRYEDFKKGIIKGIELRNSEHVLFKKVKLCKQDFIDVAKEQTLTPHVKDVIIKLYELGLILIINSAGPKFSIKSKLKMENIEYFKYICSMIPLFDENDYFYDTNVPYLNKKELFDKVKPLELIAKKENLRFDEILHIGDGMNDIAAFKKCIGVCYKPQNKKIEEYANYKIEDLREILTLIDKI